MSDKTTKSVMTVLAGNMMNSGLGFVVSIYIARLLPVEDYGVFGTLGAILFILPMVMDFGLSVAMVKYVVEGKWNQADILSSIFWFKFVTGTGLVVVSILFSSFISDMVFKDRAYGGLVSISLAGAGLLNIISTFQSFAQSRNEFMRFVSFGTLPNALRLIAIVGGSLVHPYTLEEIVVVINLIPLFTLVYGLLVYRREILPSVNKALLKDMFAFSIWVAITTAFGAVIMRVDIFMLNRLSTKLETGYYFAAFQLAMVVPIITNSITNVYLPKVSMMSTKELQQKYVRKVAGIVPFAILGTLVIWFLSGFGFSLLLGERYSHSVMPFKIMSSIFLLGMINTLLTLIVYPLNRPQLQTSMFVILLLVNVVIDLIFVPRLGAVGAALGTAGARVVAFFIVSFWIKKYVYEDYSIARFLRGAMGVFGRRK